MNTNDLRIGNRVKCKVSNDAAIYTVVAIDGIHAKIMLDGARLGTWYDMDKIKPIAITKDVLATVGFGEVGFYENVYHKGAFRVHIARRAGCLAKYEANGNCLELEIKSLHELQNLYFTLTGEELAIQ